MNGVQCPCGSTNTVALPASQVHYCFTCGENFDGDQHITATEVQRRIDDHIQRQIGQRGVHSKVFYGASPLAAMASADYRDLKPRKGPGRSMRDKLPDGYTVGEIFGGKRW